MSDLETRVSAIEARNARVEADKAWETSGVRRMLLLVITYILVTGVMYSLKMERPLINALIPTLGFFLSTLTLSFIKKRWVANYTSQL